MHMWKKISVLIVKHQSLLIYLVFGVLTTVVNYLVYLPCYNIVHISATLSNVIAWAVAVVFAYLTNKPFVFKSRDWSCATVIPELVKFVGCRIGSGLVETLIIFVTVDYLCWNGNLWKLLVSIIVVILNYVGSKVFVFARSKI